MANSNDALHKRVFAILVLVFEVILVILFATTTKYQISPPPLNYNSSIKYGTDFDAESHVIKQYPLFQDVHVMIFIGFGFLMTFLKKYGYSAIGLNLFIAAFVLQWGSLVFGFMHQLDDSGRIGINIDTLINADFTAGTILISFGAVLGKTTPLQLLIMAVFETVLSKVNEYIGVHFFKVTDVGGSMFIHIFGAYFGLAVAAVLYSHKVHESKKEGATTTTDLFSMIGTVFLWMFWPSFNGSISLTTNGRYRAIINTYFALTGAAVMTFVISTLVGKKHRLEMVHVQNASLAGGVAIGTTADLIISPWVALVIGGIAGTVSVIGYRFFTPCMNKKIHDTCGVHNLHGMPGIIAALSGILFAGIANTETYGTELYTLFPERAPSSNSSEYMAWKTVASSLGQSAKAGSDRSGAAQAGYQCAAMFITLGIAIIGGALVGLLLRIPFLRENETDNLFDDKRFWSLPAEDDHVVDFHEHDVHNNGKGGNNDQTAMVNFNGSN